MISVIDGGLSTTIQDLGRPGLYAEGIPPSGAMDPFAHVVANALLGNSPDCATLEATLLGPTLRFAAATRIAIAGADMEPMLNGKPCAIWESIAVAPGDVLRVGLAKSGCRAYLAVAGGFDVPVVLGSRSTYAPAFLGGQRGRPLRAGNVLDAARNDVGAAARKLPPELRPDYATHHAIAVMLGPQDHLFTKSGISTFLTAGYAVSVKTNRMACRLIGPVPEVRERERTADEGSGPTDIIEDGNAIGAIQIAGGTEPIIMLRDAPSSGAYAKIATVVSADLETLAQARPGDRIQFASVTFDEARAKLKVQMDLLDASVAALSR